VKTGILPATQPMLPIVLLISQIMDHLKSTIGSLELSMGPASYLEQGSIRDSMIAHACLRANPTSKVPMPPPAPITVARARRDHSPSFHLRLAVHVDCIYTAFFYKLCSLSLSLFNDIYCRSESHFSISTITAMVQTILLLPHQISVLLTKIVLQRHNDWMMHLRICYCTK
jgi:hypothetical protein